VRPTTVIAFSFAAALAAACSSGSDATDSSADAVSGGPEEIASPPNLGVSKLQHYGFERDHLSAASKKGLDTLFGGFGFHDAVPTRLKDLAAKLGAVKDAVDRRGKHVDASTPDGEYEVYGKLPSPPGRDPKQGRTLGGSVFERNGVELANLNCLSCHGGVVRGVVVAGLGNHDVDQVAQAYDANRLLSARGALMTELNLNIFDSKRDAERKELTDFLSNTEGTIVPTFKFAQARGDNMGPYAVWKRISRLEDPQRAGLRERAPDSPKTDDDRIFESLTLPTVDPNPWWTRRYKHTNYTWAESSGYDKRASWKAAATAVAAHFTLNFTTSHPEVNENHAAHVAAVRDILEFAEESTSPAFPGTLAGEKVQAGKEIFHGKGRCSGCHGTYEKSTAFNKVGGWVVDYQDKFLDVGTDTKVWDVVDRLRPMADRSNLMKNFPAFSTGDLAPQFIYPSARGYAVPVLVGTWASAPYFHNGSVPTLYGVLNSKARPKIWARPHNNAYAYSLVRVGIEYQERTAEEYASMAKVAAASDPISEESLKFRALYNTTEYGRSNAGHTFGDNLTDAERFAVIEFLKSISGGDLVNKNK